jgi:hypothetical protein
VLGASDLQAVIDAAEGQCSVDFNRFVIVAYSLGAQVTHRPLPSAKFKRLDWIQTEVATGSTNMVQHLFSSHVML